MSFWIIVHLRWQLSVIKVGCLIYPCYGYARWNPWHCIIRPCVQLGIGLVFRCMVRDIWTRVLNNALVNKVSACNLVEDPANKWILSLMFPSKCIQRDVKVVHVPVRIIIAVAPCWAFGLWVSEWRRPSGKQIAIPQVWRPGFGQVARKKIRATMMLLAWKILS